jgi:hypothetical protein
MRGDRRDPRVETEYYKDKCWNGFAPEIAGIQCAHWLQSKTNSIRILPGDVLETQSQLLADLKSGVLTYSSIDVDELSLAGRHFRARETAKRFSGRCRFARVWVVRG